MHPNQKSLDRLQAVQNSAAGLFTRRKKHGHVMPVLTIFISAFHRLLLKHQTHYIVDPLAPHSPAGTIRSLGKGLLCVLDVRLKTKRGTECFQSRPRGCGRNCPRKSGQLTLCSPLKHSTKHIFIWEIFFRFYSGFTLLCSIVCFFSSYWSQPQRWHIKN